MTAPSEQGLPPYARIAADIRARIEAGDLRAGDRAPSTREITREWGVAMATATKALSALRQEGRVEAVRRVGTVVREVSAPEPAEAPAVRKRRPRTVGAGERRHSAENSLTQEAIVQAAIAVADAEGTDGLSMRGVAVELGVSTMALYRHVDSKGMLLTAMLDEVYSEVVLPDPPPSDWRPAFELALEQEWEMFRRHPWVVRLATLSRPTLAPRLLGYAEWLMGVLTARGHSPDSAMRVIAFLSAYTSGMAVQGLREVAEEHEFGRDTEQWWHSKGPEFARFAEQGRFPNLLSSSGPQGVGKHFGLGMKCLLDGLAPLIEAAPDRPD